MTTPNTTTPRWGILGTGTIAGKFAADLALGGAGAGSVVAVGSRTAATARAFGERFGVPRRHGSARALFDDPEVDLIYVATPNSLHREHAIGALEAGKHVLCEKPFALDARQAAEMVAVARSRGLFLMEAMWTRFLPLMEEMRRLTRPDACASASGGASEVPLGAIRMVEADFGFRSDPASEPNLFDPAMGGGSLLDVGVYAVSLASMLLGAPREVRALAEIGPSGVDEQMAAILSYEDGALAICKSSLRADTPGEATIVGTRGRIRIEAPFWRPTAMTVHRDDAPPERFERRVAGDGYRFEAEEAVRRVLAGETESPLMPLDESLRIIETMDSIRRAWAEQRARLSPEEAPRG